MRKVLNSKVLLFIAAILLLANIAMLMFFVGKGEHSRKNDHRDRRKSPMSTFLEKEMNFNNEQMAAFDKMRQQQRQKMRPLFEEIRLAKVGFYGLLSTPGVNDSVLRSSASIIGQKQVAIDLQAFQNFTEIRTLCSDTQKARYDSLIAGVIGRMWFPARESNERDKDNNRNK